MFATVAMTRARWRGASDWWHRRRDNHRFLYIFTVIEMWISQNIIIIITIVYWLTVPPNFPCTISRERYKTDIYRYANSSLSFFAVVEIRKLFLQDVYCIKFNTMTCSAAAIQFTTFNHNTTLSFHIIVLCTQYQRWASSWK